MKLEDVLKEDSELIEEKFKEVCQSVHYLSQEELSPLPEAMEYTFSAGGKRIRPALVLETCRAFGGDVRSAVSAALAVELVHTYSLIQDDLPCMDNDSVRRGIPANHIRFGEAIALLASDALLSESLLIMTNEKRQSPEQILSCIALLAEAAGPLGLVGGQVLDLRGEKESFSYEQLCRLHSKKTGALFKASVLMGAVCAGVKPDTEPYRACEVYARKIGLVFQAMDDVLDVVGDAKKMGKTLGKDEESGKTTFLSFMSVPEALDFAEQLTAEAKEVIGPYDRYSMLSAIAEKLQKREN
ncbi:MAG: polyprenyl synthetase family protein [Clostridia bacterium]|nr:polyprenyl synthetase family protein [Clostridia bacterium]